MAAAQRPGYRRRPRPLPPTPPQRSSRPVVPGGASFELVAQEFVAARERTWSDVLIGQSAQRQADLVFRLLQNDGDPPVDAPGHV